MRICLIVPVLGASSPPSGRPYASSWTIGHALPGLARPSQVMPGSEFDGWIVEFSLEPNLTGAEAKLEAGAIIAATKAASASTRPARRAILAVRVLLCMVFSLVRWVDCVSWTQIRPEPASIPETPGVN